jgi:hypothetical protein
MTHCLIAQDVVENKIANTITSVNPALAIQSSRMIKLMRY